MPIKTITFPSALSQQVFIDFIVPFPLQLNNTWTGEHPKDGYEVSAYNRKIELAEQKYKRIFTVNRRFNLQTYFTLQDIDFANGIGMVRCRQGSFNGANLINDSIVLTKYVIQ